MKYLILASCLVFGAASPAFAQSKRLFPGAQCSYTLPGPDWEWVGPKENPRLAAETLAVARNRAGVMFALQIDPVGRGKPDRGTYRRFQAGLVLDGKLKAVGSRHLLIHGVPSYHIDIEGADGQRGSVRAICANDRYYTLHVTTDRGTRPTGEETAAAYQGFEFIGTPRAMVPPDDGADDEDTVHELGQRAGKGVAKMLLGPAGLVLAIIFGAWLIIWIRR
jgi:hypothetical protein